MKRIVKRTIEYLLCLALALGALAVPAGASNYFDKTLTYEPGTFIDVDDESWYADYVAAAYEHELLKGVGDSRLAPYDSIDLASVLTLAVRVHAAFYGNQVPENGVPWYQPFYQYAVECGLVDEADLTVNMLHQPATRRQMANILARAVPTQQLMPINEVEDNAIPDVTMADPDSHVIYQLYRAGVLSGNENYCFEGDTTITRCETAAVLTRLSNLCPRITFSLTPEEEAPPQDDALTVTTQGTELWLGMREGTLISRAGLPEERWPSVYGWTWYVYGIADGWQDLCLAGVTEGKVTALCVSGSGFSYGNLQMGDVIKEVLPRQVRALTDQNDKNRLHTLVLQEEWEIPPVCTGATLEGECRINLYLTNAFRVWHGCRPLQWSGAAALAAGEHSADMAQHNYFSHTAPDGSTVGSRLRDVGVSWTMCGENIAGGYWDGIQAHVGWINSIKHRENMLESSYTHLGVAGAYDRNSNYKIYFTQNFYR